MWGSIVVSLHLLFFFAELGSKLHAGILFKRMNGLWFDVSFQSSSSWFTAYGKSFIRLQDEAIRMFPREYSLKKHAYTWVHWCFQLYCYVLPDGGTLIRNINTDGENNPEVWHPEVCCRTLTPVSEGRRWTILPPVWTVVLLNFYSTSHCQIIPHFTEENQL